MSNDPSTHTEHRLPVLPPTKYGSVYVAEKLVNFVLAAFVIGLVVITVWSILAGFDIPFFDLPFSL